MISQAPQPPSEKKCKTKQNKTKLLLATDHPQLEIWPYICHVVDIILLPILFNLPVCVYREYKLGSWAAALNVWSKFYSNFVCLGFMQDAWMDRDIMETSLFLCRFIAKILANYSMNITTYVSTSVTIAFFYVLKTLEMCDAFIIQQCFQLIIIIVVVIIVILNTNIEIESSKQSPNLNMH